MKQLAVLMGVLFLGISGFLVLALARPAKITPNPKSGAGGVSPTLAAGGATAPVEQITVSQIQPLAEITASEDINSLAISADYKTGYLPSFDESIVYVIDIAGDKVKEKIKVDFPKIVALDPVKPILYVATGERELLFYNLDSKKVEGKVALSDVPSAIFVDQAGMRIFVALELTNRVAVVDLQKSTLLTMIGVGNKPRSFATKGRILYLTNFDEASLSLISLDSLTEMGRVSLAGRPNQILSDPTRDRLYISDSYNSSVLVLDSLTNTLVDSIPVAQYPMGLELDGLSGNLYVTGFAQNTLSVIDLENLKLLRTITTSSAFESEAGFSLIKLIQEKRKFYLVNTLNGKVLVYSF